ncbi:MAG: hypothetical protein JSW26_15765 [Desulfobacterales bacterium]|nr:MAG: hypothetical protein JSW26_15765 [Desulfobacterales bacterium]
MDLLTAMAKLAPPIVGKVAQIMGDVWEDYRTGRKIRQGIAVNPQGYYRDIPNVSGTMSVPESNFVQIERGEAPILLTGQFIAEESFVDFTELILEEEEKLVIVLAADQETQDVYFFEFAFDGYAISLWPGCYSFYAFIVDPILDDVLGFGYPGSEDLDDPNPIIISGTGLLEVNFIIFDADDIE